MHDAAAATTEATLEEFRVRLASITRERDEYRKAYELAQLELERLRRGLFGRKAEKVDPAQVALAFAEFEKQIAALAPAGYATVDPGALAADPPPAPPPRGHMPHGRRNLAEEDLPQEVIRIGPPDSLAQDAATLGVDVSFRVEYRKGHFVRVRYERARCVVPTDPETAARTGSPTTIVVADMPDEMIPGCIAAPGALAHVINAKFADHIPFHRLEQMMERDGFRVSRGTMCGWAAGCHELSRLVVDAMMKDAIENAHVIATDATGVLVQAPEQCRRGHFWVCIADHDHVFFRYTPRQTREEPKALFAGFRGYVQADAAGVYDAMFRQDGGPTEVACWSHARRKYFESVRSDRDRALVGIGFIGKLFEIDRGLKDLPPSKRTALRLARAGPVLEVFREWKDKLLADRDLEPRSPIARALRYTDRHWTALTRFVHDGRLRLDNNPSELELRRLVLGRKNWLFVGSDETAPVTATFVSLIASCALHGLNSEQYLRDLFRVLPSWPHSRVLELAPKYWPATRERIDPAQLAMILGPLAVPPPPMDKPQNQSRAQ
ncbi:MAG TPA: IS66 family transposase [Polyangiaceae bacterium]|nr:IS66 family transposase [Polyangiaceae bacterium]